MADDLGAECLSCYEDELYDINDLDLDPWETTNRAMAAFPIYECADSGNTPRKLAPPLRWCKRDRLFGSKG